MQLTTHREAVTLVAMARDYLNVVTAPINRRRYTDEHRANALAELESALDNYYAVTGEPRRVVAS